MGNPTHALRALGLLLADGAPTLVWGETFWRVGQFFFLRKIEKSIPRCKMNCLFEGYKGAIENFLLSFGKKRIFGPKPSFRAPPKNSLLKGHHVLATTGKSCTNKNVPFSQINTSLFRNFRCFFEKMDFGPKNTFRLDVKMAVSP